MSVPARGDAACRGLPAAAGAPLVLPEAGSGGGGGSECSCCVGRSGGGSSGGGGGNARPAACCSGGEGSGGGGGRGSSWPAEACADCGGGGGSSEPAAAPPGRLVVAAADNAATAVALELTGPLRRRSGEPPSCRVTTGLSYTLDEEAWGSTPADGVDDICAAAMPGSRGRMSQPLGWV